MLNVGRRMAGQWEIDRRRASCLYLVVKDVFNPFLAGIFPHESSDLKEALVCKPEDIFGDALDKGSLLFLLPNKHNVFFQLS